MSMTDQGMMLLSEREGGFVLKPYRDSKGIWTDGLGNTHGVVPDGPPITLDKAKADFARNMAWVGGCMALVRVPLEPCKGDALRSFIFNIGSGQWGSSTMLRKLNEGAPMDEVAAQFDRWHTPPEIISRRNGEREQFKGTRFEARITDAQEAA